MKAVYLFLMSILLVFGGTQVASAAPSTFKSCEAFNKKYPAGIARSTSEANAAFARLMELPTVNKKIYIAARKSNKRLGSPDDGVLCEVRRTVTTPSEPTALAVSWAYARTVYFTWGAPQNDGNAPITGYIVRGPGNISSRDNSAFVNVLEPSTTYTFEVVAVNAAGEGAPATITVTTAAESAPSAPTATRYATCAAAKAAGVTPLRRGTALYDANRHLDRDGDGVACE